MLGVENRNEILCNVVPQVSTRQTCCVRKMHYKGLYICCKKYYLK